jgi:cyclic dehypoxanthinyl futalosine synthase
VELLGFLKVEYPSIHIDAFSPEEILGLERLTGRKADDLLAQLKEVGMNGLPGTSAEILIDEVRQRVAPSRIRISDWFRIIDAAQKVGLHVSWVSMVFGLGQTRDQRVDHLLALKEQQSRALERGGVGFTALKVWSARLEDTRLAKNQYGRPEANAISEEFIQEVAIARLALDNIVHHRVVWRTMGFAVASRARCSRADDPRSTGSINAVDAVIRAADSVVGEPSESSVRDVSRCITEAGFTPRLRDPYDNLVSGGSYVE